MLGTIFLGGGGATDCQQIYAPIMLLLVNEGRRHEPSAAGARFVLGGPEAGPTGKFLNLESPKCHFLDFGGRFDRNLMVRKRHYNVSKFAIWLEFSSST